MMYEANVFLLELFQTICHPLLGSYQGAVDLALWLPCDAQDPSDSSVPSRGETLFPSSKYRLTPEEIFKTLILTIPKLS